jgi:VanZ family protein
LAYGLFDEWHQSFVPGRFASLGDVGLNVAGVALGIWLSAWIGSKARTVETQMNRDGTSPGM